MALIVCTIWIQRHCPWPQCYYLGNLCFSLPCTVLFYITSIYSKTPAIDCSVFALILHILEFLIWLEHVAVFFLPSETKQRRKKSCAKIIFRLLLSSVGFAVRGMVPIGEFIGHTSCLQFVVYMLIKSWNCLVLLQIIVYW